MGRSYILRGLALALANAALCSSCRSRTPPPEPSVPPPAVPEVDSVEEGPAIRVMHLPEVETPAGWTALRIVNGTEASVWFSGRGGAPTLCQDPGIPLRVLPPHPLASTCGWGGGVHELKPRASIVTKVRLEYLESIHGFRHWTAPRYFPNGRLRTGKPEDLRLVWSDDIPAPVEVRSKIMARFDERMKALERLKFLMAGRPSQLPAESAVSR